MMLSNLIVWYLFLGGLGAGSFIVASSIGAIARYRPASAPAGLVAFRPTLFVVSLLSLVAGTVCLSKDLINPQNTLSLFISPSFSIISIGAITLAALIVGVVILTLAALSDALALNKKVLAVIEGLSVLIALVVATYTGVYLYLMPAIPFWNSLFIPVLFLLSALSTGIGALFVASAFKPHLCPNLHRMARSFFVVDAIIVVLEIVVGLLFLAQASHDPFTQISVEALLFGRCAPRFLLGFVACGLAVPLVVEILMLATRRTPPVVLGFLGGCILIGGFFLRSCIIDAGIHVSALMFAVM